MTTAEKGQQQNNESSFKRVLTERLLLPVVATAASAAAGYAAKHGPRLFEEKVLPRLREAELPKPDPQRARDVVKDVNDRAKDVVQSHAPEPIARLVTSEEDRPRRSNADRARSRAERASHREARRRTSPR